MHKNFSRLMLYSIQQDQTLCKISIEQYVWGSASTKFYANEPALKSFAVFNKAALKNAKQKYIQNHLYRSKI